MCKALLGFFSDFLKYENMVNCFVLSRTLVLGKNFDDWFSTERKNIDFFWKKTNSSRFSRDQVKFIFILAILYVCANVLV